jgi:hypothetical protein
VGFCCQWCGGDFDIGASDEEAVYKFCFSPLRAGRERFFGGIERTRTFDAKVRLYFAMLGQNDRNATLGSLCF